MNTPDKFRILYNCKIKDTGYTLEHAPVLAMRAFTDMDYDLAVTQLPMAIKTEKIIAIEMPESEYERFVQNWNQYMTLMDVGLKNPQIRNEIEKLYTWANLQK